MNQIPIKFSQHELLGKKVIGLSMSLLNDLMNEPDSYLISVIMRKRQNIEAKITLDGFMAGMANMASLLIFDTLCSLLSIDQ